jgi:alkylation response protein AidB-like acyl-CoA dehydrogenase
VKFHLDPEQEALQETLARTIERVCPASRRRALLEAATDYDPALWTALMDAGVGGLLIPERYGGLDLGLENAALAMEVIGKMAAPGPWLGHILAGWAIAQSGEEDLKARWLPRLASGEAVGAVALDGWTPDDWRFAPTAGRLDATIDHAPGADQAQVIVVGLADSLGVVEGREHLQAEPIHGSDLTRRLWRLRLAGAPVQPIGGLDMGQRLLDAALVLLAADALGGAEQCLEMAVEYAKQREQFGVIIGRFQGLKHQLANMALEVEPARSLVWYAAYAWDLGLPDASRVAAHAKAHLADRFISVARAAVQAHGGIGYTWEYDLQIWFRRSLFDRAYLGAPSLHRERAAALAGW